MGAPQASRDVASWRNDGWRKCHFGCSGATTSSEDQACQLPRYDDYQLSYHPRARRKAGRADSPDRPTTAARLFATAEALVAQRLIQALPPQGERLQQVLQLGMPLLQPLELHRESPLPPSEAGESEVKVEATNDGPTAGAPDSPALAGDVPYSNFQVSKGRCDSRTCRKPRFARSRPIAECDGRLALSPLLLVYANTLLGTSSHSTKPPVEALDCLPQV